MPFAKIHPAMMRGAEDQRAGKRWSECPFRELHQQQAWRRGFAMQEAQEKRR
jgi:ribosome modulation factor